MSRKATPIMLTEEQERTLKQWVRLPKTEQRLVLRSLIILAAAQGMPTIAIARKYKVRPATVSKWRTRFAREGLSGLQDAPRTGPRRRYDKSMDRRIIAMLDEDPPAGHTTWNGKLLAEAVGGVSKHYVWRVLRRHGIQLQRRRSWCISTDPEFAAKAADIVGLYLEPPENGVVICVDEKPHIQALERAQGWLRLPNGKAFTGFSHGYRRHGTTTLFAALDIATGQVKAGHFKRRWRREFLSFMNEVIAEYPDKEIHVILDNLNTHKPKRDRWLARHKNVHFHYTPTYASWLNQVEVWFSILSRRALKGASFTSPQQVRNAIDRFVA
ncbi:MAG: IS630 family transposase, partial [Deltaproteobacteria bacterium]|nr:IS630 family transposase [Deltaproteobacteria bacterium]